MAKIKGPPKSGRKPFLWNSAAVFGACALAALTFAVFHPLIHYPFINYDDESYVFGNRMILRGFSWEALKWAFTSTRTADWQPLVWLSFMLDRQFFGLNPAGYHFTNLFWHSLNAVMIFFVFRKIASRFWAPFFLAAFFTIHPLRVESIAWIAERKDVLSGFFWWLTLWAYLKIHKDGRQDYKLPSLFFYFLGILCKPTVVTLPGVLLLLDFWPLHRLQNRFDFPALFKEKILFFLFSFLGAASALIAHASTQNVISAEEAPHLLRLSNALVSYGIYIQKTLLPYNLSLFYPFPHEQARSLVLTLGILALLLWVTILVWKNKKNRPYLFFGWIWYLMVSLPTLGVMRVSLQAMADRYTYLSHIGLGVFGIWGFLSLPFDKKVLNQAGTLLACALLIFWVVLARQQTSYWRSPIALNEHSAAAVPGNFVAYNNLGYAYLKEDNLEKALGYYQKALALHPRARSYINAGNILAQLDRPEEGLPMLQQAVKLRPFSALAHRNLAIIYLLLKNEKAAENHFLEAVKYDKSYWNAESLFLARFYLEQGDSVKAESLVRKVLKKHPKSGNALMRMGQIYEKRGDQNSALWYYEESLSAPIPSSEAMARLTEIYLARKQPENIESAMRGVLERHPKNLSAHIYLSQALTAEGKFDEAVSMLGKALQLNPDSAQAHKVVNRLIKEIFISRGSAVKTANPAMTPPSVTGMTLNQATPEELKAVMQALVDQSAGVN